MFMHPSRFSTSALLLRAGAVSGCDRIMMIWGGGLVVVLVVVLVVTMTAMITMTMLGRQ